MLEVQRFLQNHTIEDLAQFGISANYHPTDNRVILNYDQIDSDKFKANPIVRECRGLVLDKTNYKLIAKSFNRFYNYGESPVCDFTFERCQAQHKEDGSLILAYYWNGQWNINTRNSYGDGQINGQDITWRQLFNFALYNTQQKYDQPNYSCPEFCPSSLPNLNMLMQDFCKDYTYTFELCSRYNKIVTDYKFPQVFLLTCFDKDREIDDTCLAYEAWVTNTFLPNRIVFNNIDQIRSYIDELSNNNADFEGVVLKDKNGNRIKLKCLKYLELHRTKNNGQIKIEDMIAIILRGNKDEFLTYFNEFRQQLELMENKIKEMETELLDLWKRYGKIEERKEFALSIKHSKLSAFLFSAKDSGQNPVELFRNSPPTKIAKFF